MLLSKGELPETYDVDVTDPVAIAFASELEAYGKGLRAAALTANQVGDTKRIVYIKTMKDSGIFCNLDVEPQGDVRFERHIDVFHIKDNMKGAVTINKSIKVTATLLNGKEFTKEITDAYEQTAWRLANDLLNNTFRAVPKDIDTIKRDTAKVGRNDACPCGSAKKYKKCCI